MRSIISLLGFSREKHVEHESEQSDEFGRISPPGKLAFGETIKTEFGLNARHNGSISPGNGREGKGVAPSNEEINHERNQAGQGWNRACDMRGYDTASWNVRHFVTRMRGVSTYDEFVSNEWSNGTNKNLLAREWLVITCYLYIIVAIPLGRSSSCPVVANTKLEGYRL